MVVVIEVGWFGTGLGRQMDLASSCLFFLFSSQFVALCVVSLFVFVSWLSLCVLDWMGIVEVLGKQPWGLWICNDGRLDRMDG
ncbi:hypothetical protein VTJ04DRAFT_8034 [Mycothermus thermophilus]|uniref:uncharacterized protein n=1 Tax=Humicola insolens TaxID=85995 RepID=UPI0037429D0E